MMKESVWHGLRRIDFFFEEREAVLVFPETTNENKNWVLKTEYFEDFPDLQIEMVNNGWHLAYIKNVTRWCIDEDLDLKKRFAEYLHKEFGLYEKCIPIGMSCGGLIASKLAARHPECVSALYLDAPVMNLLSCPAAVGRVGMPAHMLPELTAATGMTLSDLLSYREHPIDKMHILLENAIPICMVYGDSDVIVPYHENGAILEKYYREHGGEIVTFGKAGCGHHPHGLEDNTPIVEFMKKHSK